RHEFHVGDAQFDQFTQIIDRRAQGALPGEGPHVQLVDDPTGQGSSGPGVVGPVVNAVVVDTGGGVYPVGLRQRAGVGQDLGVVGAQVHVVGTVPRRGDRVVRPPRAGR